MTNLPTYPVHDDRMAAQTYVGPRGTLRQIGAILRSHQTSVKDTSRPRVDYHMGAFHPHHAAQLFSAYLRDDYLEDAVGAGDPGTVLGVDEHHAGISNRMLHYHGTKDQSAQTLVCILGPDVALLQVRPPSMCLPPAQVSFRRTCRCVDSIREARCPHGLALRISSST